MAANNDIGKWGEDVAANLLVQKGYQIVERNWHLGKLEVDIIVQNRQTLVFVEVKTRSTRFADRLPEQYVDREKQMNICRAAQVYIKHNCIAKDIRFDIVSIITDPTSPELSRLEHVENAFFPPVRTITTGSYSGQHRWQTKGRRRTL